MDEKNRKSRRFLLIIVEVAIFSFALLYTVNNLFNHFNQRPQKSAFKDDTVKGATSTQATWLSELMTADFQDSVTPTVPGDLDTPGNSHPFGEKGAKSEANVE